MHINVLEAIALRHLLLHLRVDDPSTAKIQIRVDNTTVVHTTAKGTSRSFVLNSVIGEIRNCNLWKCVVSSDYVDTKHNEADWLSRLWEPQQ